MRGAYRRAFREGMPRAKNMICVLMSLVLWGLLVGIAAASPPVHANASEPLDSIESTKPKEDTPDAVETPPPVASGQELRNADVVSRIEAEDGPDGVVIRIYGNGKFVDYTVNKLSGEHLAVDIKCPRHPSRSRSCGWMVVKISVPRCMLS
jgi:hypothetical protein